MSKYSEIIYSKENKNYQEKLCKYLAEKYFIGLGKKLLDVGCGVGKHLKEFEKLGYDIYGTDIRKDFDHKNIYVNDIENDNMSFKDNTFDYIFSKSVLEHIIKPDRMIEEIYRVLKPNGKVIMMVPDWHSQMTHYWDDYSHYHAYTRKSLRDMLLIFGFKNVSCEYFYQLPFIWKYPKLKFIPKIISILPQSFKWKDDEERNGKDRKLIRFSKEKMLLAYGEKNETRNKRYTRKA